MTTGAPVWIGLILAAVALLAVFIWFFLTVIIPWLFNLLLAVAVGLVLFGFLMLVLQDARRR